MANSRFSVEAIFKAVDKISAPISRMQSRVKRFTTDAAIGMRRVSRTVNGIANGLKKAAMVGAAAFTITGLAAADMVRTGADFEQNIVNATVKVGGLDKTSQRYIQTQKILNDEARKLGATTEFTASQAAQGLNTLVTAGFSAEQAVSALGGVLDLATITGLEMAEAADVATGALGSFNLKVEDAAQLGKNLARVNDVLAKTTITSKNTMEDLAYALQDGGPAAKMAGADIETFAALAGKMADGNIRGTKAGTTLKNMFINLAKPVGDAEKILKRWDVKTMDAHGNMRDIVAILGDLELELNKLGTGQRAAAIETIFGKRAIAGVSVILTKGVNDLKLYRDQLSNVSGESSKMAAISRDTVKGSLLALWSAIESVKLSIFETNKGPLKDLIDSLTDWIRANEKLVASNIGQAIKDLFDRKDDILSVAKALAAGANAILDGVRALREAHGLMNDLFNKDDLGLAVEAAGITMPMETLRSRTTDPTSDYANYYVKKYGRMNPLGNLQRSIEKTDRAMREGKPIPSYIFKPSEDVETNQPKQVLVSPEEMAIQEAQRRAKQMTGEIRIGIEPGLKGAVKKTSDNLNLQLVPSGGM